METQNTSNGSKQPRRSQSGSDARKRARSRQRGSSEPRQRTRFDDLIYDQQPGRTGSTSHEYTRAEYEEMRRERSGSRGSQASQPPQRRPRQRSRASEDEPTARRPRDNDRSKEQQATGRRRAASSATKREPRSDEKRDRAKAGEKAAPSLPQLNGSTIKLIAIVVAIVVVLCIILFGIVPRCSGGQEASDQQANTEAAGANSEGSQEAESSGPQNDDGTTPAADTLKELLGDEDANKLLAKAETDEDAYWIASHPEVYQKEGWDVYWKTLKLAADEDAALKFVRDYADRYPMDKPDMSAELAMDNSSLKDTKFDTKVPHLYQWDRRWGNTVYSSAAFGLTGCGPTSIAMVYQGVTGKDDMTPYDMGELARTNGFMSEFQGTGSDFFEFVAATYGFSYSAFSYTDPDSIRSLLKDGYVIIANLGPGIFTQNGHYFVLTGVDTDGKIIINDPYSEVRSTQTWDADLIIGETIAFFAFK